MLSFQIRVRVESAALSLGGHTAPEVGGDKATAFDLDGRPLIPASALRGALRLELERLLRGLGRPACRPEGEAAEPSGGGPCTCPVCALFGRRDGLRGSLRLGDATLAPGTSPSARREVRSRVAVDRRSGSAAEGLLAFLETHPVPSGGLTFTAPAHLVEVPGLSDLDADRRHLEAAARTLTALGGGRGAGLGSVSCEVVSPGPGEVPAQAEGDPLDEQPEDDVALWLRFEALAPLHLGRERPLGAFAPTLGHAPGSTVRGAIAFALLEQGLVKPQDPALERLFKPDAPDRSAAGRGAPTWGSARGEVSVQPVTLRRCRGSGAHKSDRLLQELVRRTACQEGLGLEVAAGCWERGCGSPRTDPVAPEEPPRRVRTRTALDRRSGSAATGMLYSVEVLALPRAGHQLTLSSQVRGLTTEDARLLLRLDGRTVWLGGRRSNGFGACRLRVEPAKRRFVRPRPEQVRDSIKALGRRASELWSAVVRAAGRADLSDRFDVPLLSIVLEEPWLPASPVTEAAVQAGPLGSVPGLSPRMCVLEHEPQGGYTANEAAQHDAPGWAGRPGERSPVSAVAPGSVYVYALPASMAAQDLDRLIKQVADHAQRGSGASRETGCGRFRILDHVAAR